METLKQTPQKILDSLSKIGLQPRMTVREGQKAYNDLRSQIGHTKFDEVAESVLFNLNKIELGQNLKFIDFFKGDDCKIFLVVTILFINDHCDYEFDNTYTTVRRR